MDLDVDLDVDLNDAILLEPDPIADAALEHTRQLSDPSPCCNPGLTKRELAIFMAMQGLAVQGWTEWTWDELPEVAVRLADATIAEMNKERKERAE